MELPGFSIDPDISRAWSIPAPYYVEASIHDQEKELIFSRSWQVIGHAHQLAKPGDFFTTELLGEPLLLVRGAAGELLGFYNVCRHRAGPPAEGCGSRKLFRCGYHGWTYSLDGRLLNAPEMDGTEAFDHRQFGLQPVQVGEWGAWAFVNLDPKAE